MYKHAELILFVAKKALSLINIQDLAISATNPTTLGGLPSTWEIPLADVKLVFLDGKPVQLGKGSFGAVMRYEAHKFLLAGCFGHMCSCSWSPSWLSRSLHQKREGWALGSSCIHSFSLDLCIFECWRLFGGFHYSTTPSFALKLDNWHPGPCLPTFPRHDQIEIKQDFFNGTCIIRFNDLIGWKTSEIKVVPKCFFGFPRANVWSREVAVKMVKGGTLAEHARLLHEIRYLKACRSKHIVQFVGYSTTSDGLLLCLEFMSRGSLYNSLHNSSEHQWYNRWKVCRTSIFSKRLSRHTTLIFRRELS